MAVLTEAMTKRRGGFRLGAFALLLAVLVGANVGPVSAGVEDELIKLLIKKGVITEEEYRALRRQVEESRAVQAPPPAPESPPAVAASPTAAAAKEAKQIFKVSGTLDNEARWRDERSIGSRGLGSSANIYVRRLLIGVEVAPVDFVTGAVALQSEYVGADRTNQDGSASPTPQIDKAIIGLGRDDFPVYGVLGWRVQPFGAFYNHLITDPMTQDAYEVKRAGATLGGRLPFWDLALSATLYQGETQIKKLFEANLFDTSVVTRTTSEGLRTERDGLRSFNATAAATPWPELKLGLGYLSEPGDNRRNQTGALWGALSVGDATLEAEYMHALAREQFWNRNTGSLLGDPVKERIIATGLAYQLLPKLTLAGRYERFWDDELGSEAAIWSTDHRFSVGGAYTLWKRAGFTVQGLLEYRGSDIERRSGSVTWRNELFGRLSISYE